MDIASGDGSPDSSATATMATMLRGQMSRADDLLRADMTLLVVNLEKLTNGTTMSGSDFIEPGERLLSACGVDDYEPADDPSAEPTDEPEATDPLASLSKDEKKYVKEQVYSEPGDEGYADDVASELKKGRKVCTNIGDHGEGWSRSRYIYDREHNEFDAYDAVKYLCRKYDDDLKLAKRSIFFANNDVGRGGDDVRPGTYRTAPKVSDCYWSRLSKGGDIIANNFVEYASNGVTVTVRSSDDGFKQSGDCGVFYPAAKP